MQKIPPHGEGLERNGEYSEEERRTLGEETEKCSGEERRIFEEEKEDAVKRNKGRLKRDGKCGTCGKRFFPRLTDKE